MTIETALEKLAALAVRQTQGIPTGQNTWADAVMEVYTHPNWNGIQEWYDMYKAQPSAGHFNLLVGAMAAHQAEMYNILEG